MHVHGNHMSLALPVDTSAATKTTASQRAAEMRRKLMQGAAGLQDESSDDERLRMKEWSEDEAPAERDGAGQKPQLTARVEKNADGDDAEETRKSFWA